MTDLEPVRHIISATVTTVDDAAVYGDVVAVNVQDDILSITCRQDDNTFMTDCWPMSRVKHWAFTTRYET